MENINPNHIFRVDIKGEYALFTRPELKAERVSYDCITPSAVRGLLKSIYWHNGMEYEIDRIFVLNPIKFVNIKRNEIKSKISHLKVFNAAKEGKGNLYIARNEDIVQRTSMILKDVHYIVDAHIVTDKKNMNETDNVVKFAEMFKRRLKKGQFFHAPFLGCREFPAIVTPCEETEIHTAYKGERHLGFMLCYINYSKNGEITPSYFNAVLKDGVLDLREKEVFM